MLWEGGIKKLFEAHSDLARDPEGETVLTSTFAFMIEAVYAPKEAAIGMTFRLPMEWPAALHHFPRSVEIAESHKDVNETSEKRFEVKG